MLLSFSVKLSPFTWAAGYKIQLDRSREVFRIIRTRYAQTDGQLQKVMGCSKMRRGNHSKEMREYVITDKGMVVIGPRQTDYARLTTGAPEFVSQPEEAAPELKATS